MVVGVILCDRNFQVPRRVKKNLRDYNAKDLSALYPNAIPGDVFVKGKFIYVVLEDKITTGDQLYKYLEEMFTGIEITLSSVGVTKIVMPVDKILGRGLGVEEIAALLENIFGKNNKMEVVI